MEHCKHGIQKDWCGICTSPPAPVSDAHRAKRLPAPAPSFGYLVVYAKGGRTNESIQRLSAETTYVHISDEPMLWLIETILNRAPNLETLRVTPTKLRKLRAQHRELLGQRGVEIVTGHHRPSAAWEPDRGQISPQYGIQRKFLLELPGERAEHFAELRAFAFDAAQMTARYFCLDGEAYVPQYVIADEFGFASASAHYVSMFINAVLHYLGFSDPWFDPGQQSRHYAEVLKARVVRLRPLAQSAALRRERAQRWGFPGLASNLPLARLETYEAVLTAQREGRLEPLKARSEQAWRALTLRFGLDQPGVSVYRTQPEVADRMKLTRQRVWQLESYALNHLGIREE